MFDGKQPTYNWDTGLCNRCRYSWSHCNCDTVWIKNPDYKKED
jgi:hypothetical protein